MPYEKSEGRYQRHERKRGGKRSYQNREQEQRKRTSEQHQGATQSNASYEEPSEHVEGVINKPPLEKTINTGYSRESEKPGRSRRRNLFTAIVALHIGIIFLTIYSNKIYLGDIIDQRYEYRQLFNRLAYSLPFTAGVISAIVAIFAYKRLPYVKRFLRVFVYTWITLLAIEVIGLLLQ